MTGSKHDLILTGLLPATQAICSCGEWTYNNEAPPPVATETQMNLITQFLKHVYAQKDKPDFWAPKPSDIEWVKNWLSRVDDDNVISFRQWPVAFRVSHERRELKFVSGQDHYMARRTVTIAIMLGWKVVA